MELTIKQTVYIAVRCRACQGKFAIDKEHLKITDVINCPMCMAEVLVIAEKPATIPSRKKFKSSSLDSKLNQDIASHGNW